MTASVAAELVAFGAAIAALGSTTTGCRREPVIERSATAAPLAETSALSGGRVLPLSPRENDADWPTVAKDYANTRYSGLDEITAANVGHLESAWTFATGLARGHEAAPIVVDGTMFVVTPFPNRVHAFDLARPGSSPKWTYVPKPVPAAQGVACCDVVNRGAAAAGGRVFFNTFDGRTIALSAETGRELWVTSVADVNKGESMTMAPLVVRDRVLVGNGGGELGVRGFLAALDVKTGALRWRAYSTGSDAEVLIGDDFHPFYETDRGTDLGVLTWPPGKWKLGGGTVWGFLAYDQNLDLVYYGTGNPGPWNSEQRPGDNKWTSGVFARRPENGSAVWAYQWSPHDLYGYDGVNETVLLNVEVNGATRKILVHPDRNGYVYVLDRTTGEVLSARPFVRVTTSSGVDPRTGRLRYVAQKEPRVGKVVRDICPGAPGAKDWQPSAYSPVTSLLYIPHTSICHDEDVSEASYIEGTPYLGTSLRMVAGPSGNRGALTAWDPVAAIKRFAVEEAFPVWSGALATKGNVVFYGTMDGWFKAIHAETGELLWKQRLEAGIIGQPITYLGPEGRQYVAVFSGVGVGMGLVEPDQRDPGDRTGDPGLVDVMKDLPHQTKSGGTLHVFALAGE